MSSYNKALAAYRHGLRATKIAFAGDMPTLLAARNKMREGMVDPPNKELTREQQITNLEEIALFLRRNLVQGVQVGEDAEGKPKYHLNIHKDTERGDNDTIKNSKGTMSAIGGGCCGGGKK